MQVSALRKKNVKESHSQKVPGWGRHDSIVVSLPTGDSRLAESVYMDSRVIIGGQDFLADLILLDIHDFDVILGMDWLSRHHATVDYYRKEVRFCRPGQTEVVFRGCVLWVTEDTT